VTCASGVSARRAEPVYCPAPIGGLVSIGQIVSKQDTHFFNVFSLLIGLLVGVAILLFAFSRFVAGQTQDKEVYGEPDYLSGVTGRVEPFAREAVAGQDNAALAIAPTKPAQAGSALPVPKSGQEAFQDVCSACHGMGIAGAPKAGDAAAWGPRIAQGKPTLYDHALHGFTGKKGTMPAKGGRIDIPDAVIKQAVDYMVGMAK
jgi:cytochrome c5